MDKDKQIADLKAEIVLLDKQIEAAISDYEKNQPKVLIGSPFTVTGAEIAWNETEKITENNKETVMEKNNEREICFDNERVKDINGNIFCPLSQSSCNDAVPCASHCAWFRIHNGLAMCGDKIIGRIMTQTERNK